MKMPQVHTGTEKTLIRKMWKVNWLQHHLGPECYVSSLKVKHFLRTQVQASVVLTLKCLILTPSKGLKPQGVAF